SHLEMEVVGETQDDAEGEAFDKTAKLLGLPYPGGPLIDTYAREGNPRAFEFPTVDMQGYNFSFSGIKTAILYFLKKNTAIDADFIQKNLTDICASVQYTLVDILMRKLKRVVRETGIKRVAIAGGVSANSGLRKTLQKVGEEQEWEVFIPAFEYCTDNAGMIAMAGYYQYLNNDVAGWDLSPEPRLRIGGIL
ncbi:MAG: tRNA (adenosine(37)-N6)-threonylcarbamoyltransferase complex transferase subunit TsaD, partial [Cytophagales bacterium]|nr:tRNA (adenosine(37)-N6)-threonylcarbamoyltransferase complex transferase subunit TsaD [Cytophaga sp.]